MAEHLLLDTPGHQSHGGTSLYRIKSITFTWLDNAMVVSPSWTVELVGENGITLSYTETNPVQAETDIKALNNGTADLSVKSLQRRIIEAVTARGGIPPGTVQGVPD